MRNLWWCTLLLQGTVLLLQGTPTRFYYRTLPGKYVRATVRTIPVTLYLPGTPTVSYSVVRTILRPE